MTYTIITYQNFTENKTIIPDGPSEDSNGNRLNTEQNENEDDILKFFSPMKAKRDKVMAEVMTQRMLNAETMSQEDEINEKINFAFERVESTEARNQKFLDTANELCTMIFKGNPKAQKTPHQSFC